MSLAGTLNKLNSPKDFCSSLVEKMDISIKLLNKPRMTKANIKPSKSHCIRQMYYILTSSNVDGAESVNPDMSLIQAEGSAMHNIIQDILAHSETSGIKFVMPADVVAQSQAKGLRTHSVPNALDEETPYELSCFNDDYGVSFKFDGVLEFMNKQVLFELKNEDHFKWMKRTGPDEKHILQGTFYSLCLGIDVILFMYVDRNYKRRKCYLVNITPDMKRTQADRCKIAHHCAEKNIIPGAEKDTKVCPYCNYKKLCKQAGDTPAVSIFDIEKDK